MIHHHLDRVPLKIVGQVRVYRLRLSDGQAVEDRMAIEDVDHAFDEPGDRCRTALALRQYAPVHRELRSKWIRSDEGEIVAILSWRESEDRGAEAVAHGFVRSRGQSNQLQAGVFPLEAAQKVLGPTDARPKVVTPLYKGMRFVEGDATDDPRLNAARYHSWKWRWQSRSGER